jgi:hypothetical protein
MCSNLCLQITFLVFKKMLSLLFTFFRFFRDRIHRELAQEKNGKKRQVWVPLFLIVSFSPFQKIKKKSKIRCEIYYCGQMAIWFHIYSDLGNLMMISNCLLYFIVCFKKIIYTVHRANAGLFIKDVI